MYVEMESESVEKDYNLRVVIERTQIFFVEVFVEKNLQQEVVNNFN